MAFRSQVVDQLSGRMLLQRFKMRGVAGCSRCGAINTRQANFCSACGAQLSAVSARLERRTVTVLFTDVSGFTTLAERLDPERLQRVMERYFDEMRTIIEAHGGSISRFLGDAIMAVFGLPSMHEDDALRGVRAACEMRDRLRVLNDDLDRRWGVTLRAHTGLNTGEVVAATAFEADSPVVGDAVNVAARLQQSAEPEEILLGDSTYRLVEDAVEADPLEPLTVKGRKTPVRAARLVRMRAHGLGARRRLGRPIVGRATELSELAGAVDAAFDERCCRVIVVVGDAGVGKSRIGVELARRVGEHATVFRGHCLPYGQGITYRPISEVVKQAARIADDDGDDQIGAKLAALVEGERDGGLIVEGVRDILGPGATARSGEELFWAVRKLLEAEARRHSVLVVLDDIQWAEPTLLDLVEHFRDWTRDAPIALVCLARPELLEQRPAWAEPGALASLIRVGPLAPSDSERVIGQLLGYGFLPEPLLARVRDAAEGNPLYLEELVEALVERGALRLEDAAWVATRDLSEITVPPTIHALLATRLDRLAPGPRRVIEIAAVIGPVFERQVLEQVLTEHPTIDSDLAYVVDRELIDPSNGGPGQQAYRFHHSLIREAAYCRIPKGVRAEVHERVADTLDNDRTRRLGELDEIVGYHLEAALRSLADLSPGDDHLSTLGARAAGRLGAAGSSAFKRGDMLAAIKLLERATSLLPQTDANRLALLPDLVEATMSTGQFERASAHLTAALQAATESGNRRIEAHMLLIRSVLSLFTDPEGGVSSARRQVERVIPIFEESRDELGLARAWRLLGLLRAVWANFGDAEAAMNQAASHAAKAGDRRVEMEARAWMPLLVWAGPTPRESGIVRCEEIARSASEDPQVQGSVLLARAVFSAMEGNFEQARSLGHEARAIFEDLGLAFWIAGPWSQFVGWVNLIAGDPAAAERALASGQEALAQMGESGWLSTAAALRGYALDALGRHAEANASVALSESAAAPDDVYSQVLCRTVGAKLMCHDGPVAEAEDLARQAVRLAESTDFLQLRAFALMELAKVLELRGKSDDSRNCVSDALKLFSQKGNLVSEREAGALLEGVVA